MKSIKFGRQNSSCTVLISMFSARKLFLDRRHVVRGIGRPEVVSHYQRGNDRGTDRELLDFPA
jgi:hypothetical protein